MADVNLTKPLEHQTPGAPMAGLDPSVAPDSGILTNTVVPSIGRILNPTAVAIDNPAGTGAPFDKKDQVYRIFTRWTAKNTTVNGSVAQGAELVRISLDPMTLPPKLMDWVSMHRSCIPGIEVSIVVGGAAGTISWLALGWIPDASKQNVTLDDLQDVACEHINMNNTITMSFILQDNRRSGLFRRLPDDPEPYPGMVLMVNHPALNVQRNDDVNYPIDVYVRFAPHAFFMEPFNIIGTTSPTVNRIDLSPYLRVNNTDIVIGNANVTNPLRDYLVYPDAGFNSGAFDPTFTKANLLCAGASYMSGWSIFTTKDMTVTQVREIAEASPTNFTNSGQLTELVFGFGNIEKFAEINSIYSAFQFQIESKFSSTRYTIPELKVRFGDREFSTTILHVMEFGCILVLRNTHQALAVVNGTNVFSYKVVPDNSEEEWPSDPTVSVLYNFAATGDAWMYVVTTGLKDDKFQYDSKRLFPSDNPKRDYVWSDLSLRSGVRSDRFYTFTYILGGNNIPTTSLPTGLKTIGLVRQGTTRASSFPEAGFCYVFAPDLRGALQTLIETANKLATRWLKMDLHINGQNVGELVFADGVLACRYGLSFQIRTNTGTNISLVNIVAIENPSNIRSLNSSDFTNWIANDTMTHRPRFADKLNNLEHQAAGMGAMLGLGIGKGALDGVFDVIQMIQYQQWMSQYQKTQLAMQEQLKKLQIQSNELMQQRQFEFQQGQNKFLKEQQDRLIAANKLQQENLLRNQTILQEKDQQFKLDFQDRQFIQRSALIGYGSQSAQNGNIASGNTASSGYSGVRDVAHRDASTQTGRTVDSGTQTDSGPININRGADGNPLPVGPQTNSRSIATEPLSDIPLDPHFNPIDPPEYAPNPAPRTGMSSATQTQSNRAEGPVPAPRAKQRNILPNKSFLHGEVAPNKQKYEQSSKIDPDDKLNWVDAPPFQPNSSFLYDNFQKKPNSYKQSMMRDPYDWHDAEEEFEFDWYPAQGGPNTIDVAKGGPSGKYRQIPF